jgi:hypothetical protein
MARIQRWKSTSAALMSLAITSGTIIPIIASAPASAQRINGQSYRNISIPSGVTFPVSYEKEKVVVKPGESMPLTLRVATNIIDRNRNVLIPAGTQIVGQLESVDISRNYQINGSSSSQNQRGVRFIAQELVFSSGMRQPINASSRTISRTEKITKGADTGQILTDAAIGAGAASVISLITGNRKIEVLEPVGGAVVGAGASALLRKKQVEVFVLKPEQDLNITLNSNLILSRY